MPVEDTDAHLQSTMVRLRRPLGRLRRRRPASFTIHYGEIKTVVLVGVGVVGQHLQSTMVRLRRTHSAGFAYPQYIYNPLW